MTDREHTIASEAMVYIRKYIVEIMKAQLDSDNMTELNDHIRRIVKEVVEDHYLNEQSIIEICQNEIENLHLEDKMREIAQEEVSDIDIDTLLAGKTVTITFD